MNCLGLLAGDSFLGLHGFMALNLQAADQKSHLFSWLDTCAPSQTKASQMQAASSSEAKPQVILLPLPCLPH